MSQLTAKSEQVVMRQAERLVDTLAELGHKESLTDKDVMSLISVCSSVANILEYKVAIHINAPLTIGKKGK